MNMFDEARAISGMMELCHLTQREAAERMGVSQSYVANKLRLLEYTEDEQARITGARLTERHARAILSLDKAERSPMIDEVIRRGSTVRECEALVGMRRIPALPKGFSRAEGVELEYALEGAMRRIRETLVAGGLNATFLHTGEGQNEYYTIIIKNKV